MAQDDVIAGEEYPPDVDDSSGEMTRENAPVPRAQQIRQRALAQQGKGAAPVAGKKPHTRTKGGQRRILAQQNRKHALELRKGGATYDQIAQALGYADASGARKAVEKAIANIPTESAIDVKAIQIERLNHMLLVLWPKVQGGDERAIQTSLSVMDRLDAIEGTHAATKVDVNVQNQNAVLVIDGSKDDYIAAMKRMVGVSSDGTNIPDPQQITSHPHPVGIPVDDKGDEDVVDAVIVDDGEGASADDVGVTPPQAPEVMPMPVQPVKKTFNLGVDPTVTRKKD